MKRFILFSLLVPLFIGVAVAFALPNPDPYVTMAPPHLPRPPIKELAERKGIQVGMFASLKYLRERPYREIIADEFAYAIVDGEPNWKFEDHTLRPSETEYDFSDMDKVFEFADEHNLPVRVQHLLWGDDKWLPDWLKDGNYPPEKLREIINDHVATVMKRYKGRVREYSVVNEAISRKLVTGGNRDWWGEHLGTDYIDQAFIEARKADPNAVLLLNDFGNEKAGPIADETLAYLKAALDRGIPIDGIGMQMHIDGATAGSRQEVVQNMQRFKDLGLKIYITEFDVNMHDVKGSVEEKEQRQAQIYRDMIGACMDIGKDTCFNFGFLGMVDRQSWYNGIGLKDAMPLMFNDNYTPKAAFYALRDELSKQ